MRPLTSRRVVGICLGSVGFYSVGCGFVADGRVSDFGAAISSRRWSRARWAAGTIPPNTSSWCLDCGCRGLLLGILVGAALSTSGAGFQALLRNPLADPYVLGVSSGAALGAIISLIAAPHDPV